MGRQSLYGVRKLTVLNAINELSEQGSKPPSIREIAGATEVSVATLHSYLGKMAAEGLIEWRNRSHRTIRLTEQARARMRALSEVSPF